MSRDGNGSSIKKLFLSFLSALSSLALPNASVARSRRSIDADVDFRLEMSRNYARCFVCRGTTRCLASVSFFSRAKAVILSPRHEDLAACRKFMERNRNEETAG